jgi:hypothetical protein
MCGLQVHCASDSRTRSGCQCSVGASLPIVAHTAEYPRVASGFRDADSEGAGCFAKQSGLSPDLESTRMWEASLNLKRAKQAHSASAASAALGCRCWVSPCARPPAPACATLRFGLLLSTLSTRRRARALELTQLALQVGRVVGDALHGTIDGGLDALVAEELVHRTGELRFRSGLESRGFSVHVARTTRELTIAGQWRGL